MNEKERQTLLYEHRLRQGPNIPVIHVDPPIGRTEPIQPLDESSPAEPPPPLSKNGIHAPFVPDRITRETHPITPRIAIIDIQDTIKAQARDIATEQMRAERKPVDGKNKLTRFFKRVKEGVKDTYTRERRRQNKILENKETLVQAYNNEDSYDREATAIQSRFLSEDPELHGNQTVVKKREVLDTADKQKKQMLEELALFMSQRLSHNGETQGEFQEHKQAFFNRMADRHPKFFRRNAAYADNLWETIQQYKTSGTRNVKAEELDNAVVVGQAKDTLTTDTSNTADKMIQGIGKLSWVNEATVAAAVAAVIGARDIVSRGALSRGFSQTAGLIGMGFITGAAASSIVAAARTKGEMQSERIFLQREMQKGNTVTNKVEKYARITEYLYDKKYYLSANQTTVEIQTLLDKGDIEQARLYAADVDARIRVALEKKVGLVTYETETPALEQVQLEIAKATAKARAKELEETGGKFDLDYDELVHQKVKSIMADVAAKDKGFKRYRRKEQLKRMGRSLAWSVPGIIGGEFLQSGVFEIANHTGLIKNGKHVPVIERVYDHFHRPTQHVQGPDIIQNPSVPDHFAFVKNGNTFDVQDPNTHKILLPGLQLNSDGSISDQAKQALAAKHISVDQTAIHTTQTQSIPQPDRVTYHTETTYVSNDQWIQTHQEQLTAVHRTEWMNNNSPVPNGSELQLKAFVDQNSLQPDSQGNIVFSVADMKNYLASHGSTVVVPSNVIDSGHMELLISIDSSHSGEVFRIPVGTDGLVHVNVNSPYASLFTSGNGNFTFNGSTVEAVQNLGTVNGVEQVRVLATAVGKDNVIAMPTTTSVAQMVPVAPIQMPKDVITGYDIGLKPSADLTSPLYGTEFGLSTTIAGAAKTIKGPDNHDLAEAWYLTLGTRAAQRDYVVTPNRLNKPAYMFDPTIGHADNPSAWQRKKAEIEAGIIADEDNDDDEEERLFTPPLPPTEKIIVTDEEPEGEPLFSISEAQKRRIAKRLVSLGLYDTVIPRSLENKDVYNEAMDRTVDPANMRFVDFLLKQKDEENISLSSELRGEFGLSERYNRLSFLDSVLRYEEYMRTHQEFASRLAEYENLLKDRFIEIKHEFSGLGKNAITIETKEPEEDEYGKTKVIVGSNGSEAQVISLNFAHNPEKLLEELEKVIKNSQIQNG